MSNVRHQARVLAMQALCQWDVQKEESPGDLAELFQQLEASPAAIEYARELMTAFWDRRGEIDKAIADATEHWAFERISVVERGVLRAAVTELWLGAVPAAVVLNEAIEIGREFGGADSPRFINGVLDRVRKTLEEPTEEIPRGTI